MKHLPIIASVTKEDQIQKALDSRIKRVNLMTGSIMNLKDIITRMHEAGKIVFVHTEMVHGLGRDASAVHYLSEVFNADGMISTKSNLISAAKNTKLKTIQRIFAIDTGALETAGKMIASSAPDEVELMPGLMPRIISEMKETITKPLIVGGLIRYQSEIEMALEHGADYVSIGQTEFW